ncbi:dihydrodipicolinate synthase family protein [Bacilliculturomica massiliensis]|uniref:dihydrodipicolinate synthase family protein n=1 Tax=Bacilliculturomica massiliensis TaxID=1917867 RepID=UPI0013EF3959|nr:dihydrodipicolinate synthase family protein [Bacilliculturomica massiliensis]
MSKKYHGVIPPILTPIDEQERVDEESFRRLIDRCIDGGLHGIFVAGTNGETMALTQKERNRAIKIAIDQAAGRVPVISGVMDSSTKRVIENIKELEQMGGTCAAVTSIFYDRHTSQDETIRHFEKIAGSTELDLMIYNIPPFTGLKLSAATVTEIAGLDRVVGYKDSSGSFTEFLQLVDHFEGSDFVCLQGITPHALPSLLLGADGFVPALGPLFPELFVEAYEAGISGNIPLAKKYNRLIRESSRILGMTKNGTAAAKYAVSLTGLMDKRVIMPQDFILPEEEERVKAQVERVSALHEELKRSLS